MASVKRNGIFFGACRVTVDPYLISSITVERESIWLPPTQYLRSLSLSRWVNCFFLIRRYVHHFLVNRIDLMVFFFFQKEEEEEKLEFFFPLNHSSGGRSDDHEWDREKGTFLFCLYDPGPRISHSFCAPYFQFSMPGQPSFLLFPFGGKKETKRKE